VELTYESFSVVPSALSLGALGLMPALVAAGNVFDFSIKNGNVAAPISSVVSSCTLGFLCLELVSQHKEAEYLDLLGLIAHYF